jgi:hypothetical protein
VSGANVLGFNGAGVADVSSDVASAMLSRDIAIAMVVRLAQKSSGYLIANADPNGRSRYLGLWHSGSVVVWYFRVAGDARLSARFELPSTVADGSYHKLVFRVGTTAAILDVDCVPFVYSLGGLVPIACGGGCRVTIGGRPDASGSAFRITGNVAMARVCVPSHPPLVCKQSLIGCELDHRRSRPKQHAVSLGEFIQSGAMACDHRVLIRRSTAVGAHGPSLCYARSSRQLTSATPTDS